MPRRREKVDETTPSITLHGIISRLLDRETAHLAADHYFLEGHREIQRLDGYICGYTFDTTSILVRYSTIQVMGKIHPAEWGKWVGILL